MGDGNWNEEEGAGEEEDGVLARKIRSPQDFDDDVEMSSDENRNRGRGKPNARDKGKPTKRGGPAGR